MPTIAHIKPHLTFRLLLTSIISTFAGGIHFGYQLSVLNPISEILKDFLEENLRSGITALSFFGATLLRQVGFDDVDSKLINCLSVIPTIISSLIATLIIDRLSSGISRKNVTTNQ
ncbi:unnamed protein product [Caenorhabditis angaria]|uniref:Uncharacterized protein n=1 Tax=Caenorhabditis angaria TaxID=860376 RepID=A0A9P1N6M4_9PELO|nr:unnamed protein product [Caenorhabditis angaria]